MRYSTILIAGAAVLKIGLGFPAPSLFQGLDRVLPAAEAQAQDAWLLTRPRDGIAPNSSSKPTMDPPPMAPTGPPGILPDGSMARCTLGPGRMQIGSEGQVVFSQLFAQQNGREFGRNGCDGVVSYPKAEGTEGN